MEILYARKHAIKARRITQKADTKPVAETANGTLVHRFIEAILEAGADADKVGIAKSQQ